MAITNYQGGADTIFDYRNINRVAERELARKATVAQSKAKAAEDQAKEIAAIVAKINPNGLRDGDLGEYSKQYTGINESATKIRKATTIEERATGYAELDERVQNIRILTNSSKTMAKEYESYGTNIRDQKDRVSDAQRTQYIDLNKRTTAELRTMDLGNIFKLGIDRKYIDSTLKDIESGLQKVADNSRSLTFGKDVNKNGNTFMKMQNEGRVTPEQGAQGYGLAYKNVPMFKDFVDEQAKVAGVQPDEYIRQLGTDASIRIKSAGDETLKDTNAPRPVGGGAEKESPLQTGGVIPVKSMNYGNSNLELYNYTPLAQSVQRVAGTFTMQDAQGNIIKTNKSTAEYEVVGVAKVPVAVRNMNLYKKGAVVTPRFAKANPSMVEFKELAVVSNKTNMSIDGRKYTVGNDFLAEVSDVLNPNSLSSIESKSLSFARKEPPPSWYTDSNKSNTPKPASSGGYTQIQEGNYNGNKVTLGVKNGKWYNTKTGQEIK